MASAVVAATAHAIRLLDLDFLMWLAQFGDGPRALTCDEHALAWCNGDASPADALRRAADAWAALASTHTNNSHTKMIAACVAATDRAIRRADEPLLTRIWTWAYGTPLPPEARRPRSTCELHFVRLDDPEIMRALARAVDGLVHAAALHPHDPTVGLVACVLTSVEKAILTENREALARLRECVAPTPAVDALRARGLSVPERLLAALQTDAPVRSMVNASEEWRRATSAAPSTKWVNDYVALFIAINTAVLTDDRKEVATLARWAHRYIQGVEVLPTHDRAARADRLEEYIKLDFEHYHRSTRTDRETVVWRWSDLVLDVAGAVIDSLPEYFFAGEPDLSAMHNRIAERLSEPRERERLCRVYENEGPTVGSRAILASALKANDRTEGFANNLFAHVRASDSRKKPPSEES